MSQLLVPLVLVMNGLAGGVLVGTQLGGWPLLESLPPDRYVQAHAFFSTRFDPFMPGCLVGTVVGDVLLGFTAPSLVVGALFLVAGAVAIGSVAISIARNVPANRWIRTLDPAALPADFAERDPRRSWGSWNRARTGLVVLALLVNCAAVGLLL